LPPLPFAPTSPIESSRLDFAPAGVRSSFVIRAGIAHRDRIGKDAGKSGDPTHAILALAFAPSPAANKEVAVAAVSWLKYARLAFFSKPQSERQLYRLVKLHKICRIVEVGIGSIARTTSLIGVAQRYAEHGKVAYTGLDWFEARAKEQPKLTLKQAYAQLQATGAQVRLAPGEPGRSVATVANAHQHTGLVLISAAVDDDSLAESWFYVPRMLDDLSVVLREGFDEAGEPTFKMLEHEQIVAWAGCSRGRRAA
jgi:hypothetical protein